MELDEAAKVYHVEEIVENLRKLSMELRNLQITVKQSLDGSRILKLLEELNIDQKELKNFLNAFFKHVQESEYDSKTLVSYAVKLADLEKRTGLDHPSFKHTKRRLAKSMNLLKRINENEEQIKIIDYLRKTGQSPRQTDLTMDAIREYEDVRADLIREGVEIRDTKIAEQ